MEHAEGGVDRRELHDRRLERHPEDAAREGLSIASPPPGTLFATRTAAAEATTYTMPMNASCGTRRSSRGDERVRANTRAPTAVANRAKTYAHVESASTWISNAESPPRAAICARERSTKITSRAITWSPR